MNQQPSTLLTELDASERETFARAVDFADREMKPHAAEWAAGDGSPAATLQRAAGEGLLGLLVPAELSGLGLRPSTMAALVEALAARDFFFTFALVVHNNLAHAIARHGTSHHRERYLPALLNGTRIGAFLLTEPGAGSDAAAITTSARREGDGWLLSGEKAWISNAAYAGLLSVYAQTDQDAGSRGIGAFLVEAEATGVQRQELVDVPGGRALGVGGFRFEHCRLDAAASFLPPGRAFKTAMEGIDLARVMVAAMCCGVLEEALSSAVGYSTQRHTFGQPLSDHQGLRWMLADASTDLAAARALTRQAARCLDDGANATLAAAHAKKFATRAAFRRVADCMQVHGANGLSPDLPLSRHLAAAKVAQYLDGTTEIQNVVIGRALVDPRS